MNSFKEFLTETRKYRVSVTHVDSDTNAEYHINAISPVLAKREAKKIHANNYEALLQGVNVKVKSISVKNSNGNWEPV